METRYTTDVLRGKKEMPRMSRVLSADTPHQTSGVTKPQIDGPSILGNNKYLPRKSKLIVDYNTSCMETPIKSTYELESHTFLPPFFAGSPEDSFMSHLEMRIGSYWMGPAWITPGTVSQK